MRMAGRLWWTPLVVVGLAVDRGSRLRWLLTPGIVAVTACAAAVAKLVIRRPRPGSTARIAPLGRLGAAGFPSTHAACAFAIAGWLRGSRGGRWLHMIAVAIGYLRVRRRAHHWGDVVAGAALGYGIARRVDDALPGLPASHVSRPAGSTTVSPAPDRPAPRSGRSAPPRSGSPPRRRRPAPPGHGAASRPSVMARGMPHRRNRLIALVSTLAVR